jgi:hypothetical protein
VTRDHWKMAADCVAFETDYYMGKLADFAASSDDGR